MNLGLADRVFVVTGGTSGLGFATAQTLVAEGAKVVVSGRDGRRAADAAAILGPSAVGISANNADPSTPQLLIATAQERFGRLDGALISVGGPAPGTVLSAPDEAWQAAVESVFLGTVRLARDITAALSPGGSVALVLSTSAKAPVPGLSISNALRPGLAMLVKDLASEVGPRGIRVNALLPGRLETDRIRELEAGSPDPAATRAAQETLIPLGRYGEPEEFGSVATFVLSPAASYICGAMVPVDGGLSPAP
ncbi:MAG: SDR family oxidoreductase [Nocardioidaceae bacterium]